MQNTGVATVIRYVPVSTGAGGSGSKGVEPMETGHGFHFDARRLSIPPVVSVLKCRRGGAVGNDTPVRTHGCERI